MTMYYSPQLYMTQDQTCPVTVTQLQVIASFLKLHQYPQSSKGYLRPSLHNAVFNLMLLNLTYLYSSFLHKFCVLLYTASCQI